MIRLIASPHLGAICCGTPSRACSRSTRLATSERMNRSHRFEGFHPSSAVFTTWPRAIPGPGRTRNAPSFIDVCPRNWDQFAREAAQR